MSGKRSRHQPGMNEAREQRSRSGIGSNRRRLVALLIIALAIAAAAVIAVVAFGGRGKVEKPSAQVASRQAPKAFRTVLANGSSFSSRDLAGKPTVAAFVIENCTSCVETLQTLTALSRDGVRTIAVNVNVPPGTSPAAAARRLASFGRVINAGGEILYAADPAQRTAAAFGVRQIESYLLFDAHGREVGHGVALSATQIRRALKLT